jgi:hypothetical protein
MPSLNFSMQFQQHLNWCWAATTVAVTHYYTPGSTLTQCVLVNVELGRSDCCQFQAPWHACNSTYNTGTALTTVGHLAQAVAAAATFPQAKTEIDQLRPFVLRLTWLLGGAHAVSCSGYYQTIVGNFLLIKDPTFGVSLVPFAVFPTLYWGSLGGWSDTYFTQ